jgi:DNA repair photolyase
MSQPLRPTAQGRGAQIKPPNRFIAQVCEDDFEQLAADDELLGDRQLPAAYLPDDTQSIVSENDSPDISFRYSLNPYHGCAYCYARPLLEYLGFNAGLDFETKIMFKPRAAELFRDWLNRPGATGELVMFSGVTDCYQLAERKFGLTRACLDVALEGRLPVAVITKNALVTRDIDLFAEMAKHNIIAVVLSITTLDAELAHTMEPRTSPPASRLKAVEKLAAAGIPTSVMVAPIVPGLNDSEIPAILAAAAAAGAAQARFTMLRLLWAVKPIFLDWLARTQPEKQAKIESRIRATRDGKLNNSQFGQRMRGSGAIAEQIEQTFRVFAKKYRLDQKRPPLDASNFRPPTPTSGQLRLF